MKKNKADSLLKSFNKQKMATLTNLKGKSLDYACAIGGKGQDHGGLISAVQSCENTCHSLILIDCLTDECDETNGDLCNQTIA